MIQNIVSCGDTPPYAVDTHDTMIQEKNNDVPSEPTKLTPQFIASELREIQSAYQIDAVDDREALEHFEMWGSTEEINKATEKALSEGLIFRPRPNALRAV